MRWNYHFDTPDNFTTEIFSKCLRNFTSYPRNVKGDMGKLLKRHWQSISSGQRNLMKTYHNEANTGGITKIASKKTLASFRQMR